jgi:hypothetical protein
VLAPDSCAPSLTWYLSRHDYATLAWLDSSRKRFLLTELFPQMRKIPGFLGADVLRHAEQQEVAFVTLTRFDTVDSIRAFAGEDYETPVLEPAARALLSRYDSRAQHFETSSFLV